MRFSSQKREAFFSKSVTDLPGPGNYENDNKGFGKSGVQISIRGKRKEMRDS
jgi:hypothetical protein